MILRLDPRASAEIVQIAAEYAGVSQSLARRFRNHLDRTVDLTLGVVPILVEIR